MKRDKEKSTTASRDVDALRDRKVNFAELKPAGSELNLYESLARDLAREYERTRDRDYVSISWDSQAKAQDYFNRYGFELTLKHMLELREQNA